MALPRVTPLRGIRPTPILPIAYDDSLSYMEVLYKLIRKANECIETLNDLSGVVENHETRITDLEVYIRELDGKFNAFKAYVQNQIDTFEAQVNNDFATLEAELRRELDATIADVNRTVANLERVFEGKFDELSADLIRKVNNSISQMSAELLTFQREIRNDIAGINVRIDMLYAYINEILEDIAEHIPIVYYVKSPFTGKTITVQQAIDELYEKGNRTRACTCQQFESLELTASEFDALELTAYEFDMFGLDKLPFKDYTMYMFSPFNGEWTSIKNVIIGLANLHQLASDVYTASERDALDLTASYLDGLEVTAFNLDWHDRNYVA